MTTAVGGVQRVNALIASDGSGHRRCNSLLGWFCGGVIALLFRVLDVEAAGNGRFLISTGCFVALLAVALCVAVDPISSFRLACTKSSCLESEEDDELEEELEDDDEEEDEDE